MKPGIDYEAIVAQCEEDAIDSEYTEEDLEHYEEQPVLYEAMWEVTNSMEDTLAAAVTKVRKEQKRTKMAHGADRLQQRFGNLLYMIAESGYVREDDMGFHLFREARSEMREWSDGAGQRSASGRKSGWF